MMKYYICEYLKLCYSTFLLLYLLLEDVLPRSFVDIYLAFYLLLVILLLFSLKVLFTKVIAFIEFEILEVCIDVLRRSSCINIHYAKRQV